MLTRILNAFGYEKRATEFNPAYAPDVWGRALRPSPYPTAANVLSNLAVASRCVALRSELLASVPCKVYRRLPNGDRERVRDHPLALILGDLSNPMMTAFEVREHIVRSLDTAGNAFCRIERNGRGQVIALWPLHPLHVQVERLESGRVRYRYTAPDQRPPTTILMEEMLHVRASSEDGLLGRSPISIARAALGVAISQNETAGDLARTGYKIAGYLMQPEGKSGPSARRRQESVANREDAAEPVGQGRIKSLDPGAKFIPAQFSGEDAQLLESRKLSNEDVARIFGVPGGAVGIRDSVSYGSAEADARALVQNCLQPLAERVEQALMRCLLTTEGRRNFIIEHDLRGLLRGNMAERFNAYRIGREIGMYSANDLRRFENESAIEDGDTYLQPVTLAGSSAPADGGAS